MNSLRTRTPSAILTTALLATGLALTACKSGPTARVMDDSEGEMVGNTQAGAAVYKSQVESVVQEMLASPLASNSNLEKAKLCVLRVENASAEELGDWSEQLFSLIRSSIDQSGRFGNLSTRTMDRALQEGGMRQDDLLLPKYQREFSAILESSGEPIQYLVYPRLSSGTTTSGKDSQRDYYMELELVAIANGESVTFTSKPIRKAYRQ
jgi:hypothetical protein